MKSPIKPLIATALLFAIGACAATTTAAPNGATAVESTTTSGDRARRVYERRCGSCHALYAPSSYTAAQWRGIVDEMADMAHLSENETALVLDYVLGR